MKLTEGVILEKIYLSEKQILLKIFSPKTVKKARPGEFVSLKANLNQSSPLLRRPFSIHAIDRKKGILEIYLQVLGLGTEELRNLDKGDTLSVLGPLGTGFELVEKKKALFIGGGLGQAPFRFLAEELKEKGTETLFIVGARNKEDLNNLDYYVRESIPLKIYTEDGSLGSKGRVTDDLEEIISEYQPDIIYACGPMPMLLGIKEIVRKKEIACQISLEEKMACGIGVCLGCTCGVKEEERYKKVCIDGPVFWLQEVL